jgi:hypothetical protein
MVLPITHLLSSFVILEWAKQKFKLITTLFTPWTYIIAFFAAGLPDSDILITLFLKLFNIHWSLFAHRGIMHTPFFALFFVVAGIIFIKYKKEQISFYFFVVAAVILIHLIFDTFIGIHDWLGIMWLYPISNYRFDTFILSQMQFYYATIALDAGLFFELVLLQIKNSLKK